MITSWAIADILIQTDSGVFEAVPLKYTPVLWRNGMTSTFALKNASYRFRLGLRPTTTR